MKTSDAQLRFYSDLVKDLRRLFHAKNAGKTETDFVAWMGGTFSRVKVLKEPRMFGAAEELDSAVRAMTVGQARKLIKALAEVRERIEAGLTRETLATPPPILRAIWAAARPKGMDHDAVAEIVSDVTEGATSSTKNLHRDEALAVLRRVGGTTKVFEMTPPRYEGGRPGMREKSKTIV